METNTSPLRLPSAIILCNPILVMLDLWGVSCCRLHHHLEWISVWNRNWMLKISVDMVTYHLSVGEVCFMERWSQRWKGPKARIPSTASLQRRTLFHSTNIFWVGTRSLIQNRQKQTWCLCSAGGGGGVHTHTHTHTHTHVRSHMHYHVPKAEDPIGCWGNAWQAHLRLPDFGNQAVLPGRRDTEPETLVDELQRARWHGGGVRQEQ